MDASDPRVQFAKTMLIEAFLSAFGVQIEDGCPLSLGWYEKRSTLGTTGSTVAFFVLETSGEGSLDGIAFVEVRVNVKGDLYCSTVLLQGDDFRHVFEYDPFLETSVVHDDQYKHNIIEAFGRVE